jgi:membrane protein YdbS with pleckstrin-like domain
MANDTSPSMKKKCPFCGEMILTEAVKCRFCGEFLSKDVPNEPADDTSGTTSVRKMTNPPYNPDTADGVLLEVRPSLAAMANFFLLGIIVIAAGVVGEYMLPEPYNTWVMLGVIGLVVLWLGVKVIILKCTSYRISQDRIEYERGVLNRCMDNLDMFRVTDVRLHRTLLDRLWGIGTVEVLSSDETHPTLWLAKIRDPRNAYDILKRVSLNADQRRGVVHME